MNDEEKQGRQPWMQTEPMWSEREVQRRSDLKETSRRYRMPEKAKPRLTVVPKRKPNWWPLIAIALLLVMAWRFWPKK